jgi:DHA1 family tetracycline resistance protein-like MFS transporter
VVALAVQGFLLGRTLKVISPQRLATRRIGVLDAGLSAAGGAATEGWMMFAVIGVNLFGATVATTVQSTASRPLADGHSQGQTTGRRHARSTA